MSLLAPLYFLGALAISLPVIFHLIRRQPQGEVPFSSLMFLRPTPPRLTRRSRLENWPLLLIRAMILGLLAAAFARPLFRNVELADAQQIRTAIVLLVDTSASMQRTGLWDQSLGKANDVIDDLKLGDQIAVVTFDQQPKTLFSFDQSTQIEIGQLKSAARKSLQQASPTWHRTDMGRAIRFAAELATSRDDAAAAIVKIVLISDMQESVNIDSLQSYSWPEEVSIDVRRVTAMGSTNASIAILIDSNVRAEGDDQVRVRVANSANSKTSNFRIGWQDDDAQGEMLPAQVPPGQSRVLRLPRPPPGVTSVGLVGDDDGFDNQRYYVVPESRQLKIMHVGPEAKDPRNSLVHYLRQAPLSDRYRTVSVDSVPTESNIEPPQADTTPLVVIEDVVSDDAASGLTKYLNDGGRMLVVLSTPERSESILASCNAITDSELVVGEAVTGDYAMLSKIDFQHPLFAPLSQPPYNDFSKIRFWSHRSIAGLSDAWSVLANFDDGSPALMERTIGRGTVWILAAGWQPEASQLAMSTKFVPLLFRFVHSHQQSKRESQISVGDAIPFDPSSRATIHRPDGSIFAFRSMDDLQQIDLPGVYQWNEGDQSTPFAVNLHQAESRTEPLGDDALEQFGVKLDSGQSIEATQERQRQLRDRELEGRQRIWQWLLVAALGLLGLETWIGSRAGKQSHEPRVT